MNPRINFLVWVVLGAVLCACQTTQPYEPFKIERSEIVGRVKTVAMLPVAFPGKLDRQPEIAERYESLIVAKLAPMNFTIVPSSQYSAIWDPMVEKVGGFFDPVTGEIDSEEYQAVRDLAMREMVDRHGVDAFLLPSIEVVKAYWSYNLATWHGTTEAATGEEGFAADFFAPAASGNVSALSLAVVIANTKDEIYYVNYGGIQLLFHVGGGGNFVRVPEQELFVDPARDEQAVAISLAPLLGENLAASR